MSEVIEHAAQQAVEDACSATTAPALAMRATMRLAGERLASILDHDEASAAHASLARQHAEKATRAKGRNRR